MNFTKVMVKSPTANLSKGDITLSFEVSAKWMNVAQELAKYAHENLGTVEISILAPNKFEAMRFPNASVKNPKADLAKQRITIAFIVGMEFMETAKELAVYGGENLGAVSLEVHPRQLPLKGIESVTLSSGDRSVELRPGLRAFESTGEIDQDGDDDE